MQENTMNDILEKRYHNCKDRARENKKKKNQFKTHMLVTKTHKIKTKILKKIRKNSLKIRKQNNNKLRK